ncbi:MAG: hypothetical protein ABIP94_22235 [Planctomycetota bacterium]
MSLASLAPSAVLGLLLLGAALPAQTCGPFNISTAVTGPGCAPMGGGIPTLSAALGPSTPGACSIPITFAPPPSISISPPPVFLAAGFGNPMLDLSAVGWPGCMLWCTLDVIVAVPPSGSPGLGYTATLTVVHDPALVGVSVFTQGMMLSGSPAVVRVALSNGLVISL